MPVYGFGLIVGGLDAEDEDACSRVRGFVSGVSDIATTALGTLIRFAYEAPDPATALREAIAQTEGADDSLRVQRVRQDLVSVAEIAVRLNRARAAVASLIAAGGEGFPEPVQQIGSDLFIWSWFQVWEWLDGVGLRAEGRASNEAIPVPDDLVAMANGDLADRRQVRLVWTTYSADGSVNRPEPPVPHLIAPWTWVTEKADAVGTAPPG